MFIDNNRKVHNACLISAFCRLCSTRWSMPWPVYSLGVRAHEREASCPHLWNMDFPRAFLSRYPTILLDQVPHWAVFGMEFERLQHLPVYWWGNCYRWPVHRDHHDLHNPKAFESTHRLTPPERLRTGFSSSIVELLRRPFRFLENVSI